MGWSTKPFASQNFEARRLKLGQVSRSLIWRFALSSLLRERQIHSRSRLHVFVVTNVLFAMFLTMCAAADAASAQELAPSKPVIQEQNAASGGRLYFFRPIRSYGAHIDDYITVNGISVNRLTPGAGFYCDVPPGDYEIGVARHKTNPMKVSVAAGESHYICVMLRHLGGVAPRGGALTSDQSFELRLLQPGYGAERIREYHLSQANCQR